MSKLLSIRREAKCPPHFRIASQDPSYDYCFHESCPLGTIYPYIFSIKLVSILDELPNYIVVSITHSSSRKDSIWFCHDFI